MLKAFNPNATTDIVFEEDSEPKATFRIKTGLSVQIRNKYLDAFAEGKTFAEIHGKYRDLVKDGLVNISNVSDHNGVMLSVNGQGVTDSLLDGLAMIRVKGHENLVNWLALKIWEKNMVTEQDAKNSGSQSSA